MFVIQYQGFQVDKWYDDSYFEHRKTLENIKYHFEDKLNKIAIKNKNVRYRIVERVTKDNFVCNISNGTT